MNDADSVLLSVRAEARHLAAQDYAALDGLIEHGGVFHFDEIDGDAGGSARPSLRERRDRRGDPRHHRALPGSGPGAWARRAGSCLLCR
jgi:hypothetical protein